MKKRLLVLIPGLLLLTLLPATAEVVSKVAAVVNDSIITTHQLEKRFEEALKLSPAAKDLGAAEKGKLRLKVLDQMVEEKLYEERVKALKIRVDESEVDAAIDDVRNQNSLSLEQLKSALKAQGMDYQAYRESLRKQIVRFRLIGMEVQSKAEVTSAEMREYYREHIEEYREKPFMHLSSFNLPIPEKAATEQIDDLRKLAVEARGKLADGESIAALTVSYATSGATGGDMGKFRQGELAASFDKAVRDLNSGEVSSVVEMPNGFFVFKMVEKSSGAEKPFDAVSAEIEQILLTQKREQAFKDWNKSLRRDAYIDIRI